MPGEDHFLSNDDFQGARLGYVIVSWVLYLC